MLALLAALVAGCANGGEEAREAPPGPPPPRVAVPNDASPTKVDVGGYRLTVRCSGRGRPAVVLEAGYGLSSGRWRAGQRAIARTNRVCAYDRQGVGRSDARPSSYPPTTPAEELHRLLGAIRLRPPYVLAGHSLGGGLAVGYAAAYPGEVVGLVLVDSVHPDDLPGGAVEEGRSFVDLGWIARAVREEESLARRPLVVLERGLGRDPGWSARQRDLARLTSNSAHVVARTSGHHIQAGQPDLVAAAVRAVVRAARSRSALPPCGAFARYGGACPAG